MDRRTLDRLPGLVELRNYLQTMAGLNTLSQSYGELRAEYTNMLGIDDVYSAEIANKCVSTLDQLITSGDTLRNNTINLLESITKEIDAIAAVVSTKDYFEKNLLVDDQSRQSWRFDATSTNAVIIECSDPQLWKYPACCINAQHEDFVNVLRSADLLYLVDYNPTLLEQHVDSITNRVKLQRVSDFNNPEFDRYLSRVAQHTRWGIPKGQMAIVLCWHLFQRYTLEVMEEKLQEIKELLRPGGKFVFNVNNADNIAGARMVSLHSCSYATKATIEDMCKRVGLVFNKWEPILGTTTALVSVSLPGELRSVKYQASRGIIKKS